MIAGTESGRDMLWQRFTVAIPYIWLLIFFLAPFAIILKISSADPIIGQPPFTPVFDDDGTFLATLDSFKLLLSDKLYGITYLRSVIMAQDALSTDWRSAPTGSPAGPCPGPPLWTCH